MNSSNPMANAATNSHPSMVLDMESLRTQSTVEREAATFPKTQPGPVADTPAATASATIPARSGLSETEQLKLAQIKRNRRAGWMPTFEETDFLIAALERFL